VHVISLGRLKEFYGEHPESRPALLAWYRIVCASQFSDSESLRQAFAQVDYVKPFHVFNIGRSCRLVAAIHFNRQRVFVRHVLTHAEYDRGHWRRG
jgi:mRNA interferase HigB